MYNTVILYKQTMDIDTFDWTPESFIPEETSYESMPMLSLEDGYDETVQLQTEKDEL